MHLKPPVSKSQSLELIAHAAQMDCALLWGHTLYYALAFQGRWGMGVLAAAYAASLQHPSRAQSCLCGQAPALAHTRDSWRDQPAKKHLSASVGS